MQPGEATNVELSPAPYSKPGYLYFPPSVGARPSDPSDPEYLGSSFNDNFAKIPETTNLLNFNNTGNIVYAKFLMPGARFDGQPLQDGDKMVIRGQISGGASGSSDCLATFVADVPGGGNTCKCPYLKGAGKTLSLYVHYMDNSPFYADISFNPTDHSLGEFEVQAMAYSPTDSMPCADSSRCYYLPNGQQRNFFVELQNAESCSCNPVAISRISLGCFAEDTQIATDKSSTRLISALKIGDKVWNPITQSQAAITEISVGPEDLPLILIKTAKGDIKVTTEHPILTNRGLVTAELIDAGRDRLVYEDGSLHEIISVASVVEKRGVLVYNIKINPQSSSPDDHMLLAGKLVSGDLYLQNQLKQKEDFKRLAACQ